MFEILKVFKAVVEKLSGKKGKVLRTDNEKEYINNKIQHIFQGNDI